MGMSDQERSVGELKHRVADFCSARDWDQFHGPKSVAAGLVTEAAELLAELRFATDEQEIAAVQDPARRERLADELADVFFFLLRFAQRFDFDLSECLDAKLAKNAERYSVAKSRGRNAKYDEL